IGLARQQITDGLREVVGDDLVVVESLDDLLRALPGAEGLVLADAPPDEARQVVAALDSSQNTVRWMHIMTAGREGFEIAGLPKTVPVTYAAGGVAPTVAEHAMALLLGLGRNLPGVLTQQAERRWSREASAQARSLEGSVMAIVGDGQIGREIARRARAFGMTIVGVTRSARSDALLDRCEALEALPTVLA